jgi:hypothetical protein
MKQEIEELKAYSTRLRGDLMATNLVMSAIVGSLPPAQHLGVLRAIAQLSVMQEQTVGQSAKQAEAMQPVQQSVQRLHDHLQGLYKLRKDV